MSDAPALFPFLLQRVRQELLNPKARQPVCTAAAELVKYFEPILLNALRSRLHRLPQLRRLYEPADFAQEIWLDFFDRRIFEKDFASPDALAGYLTKLGRGRIQVIKWAYLGARKRNLAREVSLDALAAPGVEEFVSHEPGPGRVVSGRDECEHVLENRAVADRKALLLLGEGFPIPAVAEKLGVSESTVKRVTKRARAAHSPT